MDWQGGGVVCRFNVRTNYGISPIAEWGRKPKLRSYLTDQETISYSLMRKSWMKDLHKIDHQKSVKMQSWLYLCVVPRPRFVRVHAPLLILGSRPVQEKRDVIIGIPAAVFCTSAVALRST